MNINKNVQGHLFALTANVMWGLMAPIGKFALQEFSALSVTTFRMVGAAAAFWILSIFCKQEYVNHKDMLKIFFASLFALVFMYWNWAYIIIPDPGLQMKLSILPHSMQRYKKNF